AEEGGHGAREMIADGALTGDAPGPGRPVDVVFGWHNWPAVGPGRFACPDGAVMSANGTFEVEVTGVGGHASQPELTRDPVLASAATTVALQQLVSRRLPPQVAAVVAVTWIDAPGSDTVTPATVRLGGSIRVPDTGMRDVVFSMIEEVADATARAHGVVAATTLRPRYAATVNHPAPAAELRTALVAALEDNASVPVADPSVPGLPVPVMASEDFSYYLSEIPGAFALVGSSGEHSCHSPLYDFDDTLIAPLVRAYARLAGAPAPPAGG
ncbi:MAG: peptidase dimerization domain-containing protein, partial [Nocardioides sp.]|nr:peptidase dimerization domain-containing protein [Nocardioides sp.]